MKMHYKAIVIKIVTLAQELTDKLLKLDCVFRKNFEYTWEIYYDSAFV